MSDFKAFDDKLAALLASLSPASRRQMAATVEFAGKVQRIARIHQEGVKRQTKPA